jgi:hypothetical protein
VNRRNFCLTSAAAISGAAAGLPALPRAAQTKPAIPADSGRNVPIYKFIYDRRFSAARIFGAAAERAHSTAGTVAIDGDITALWSRDLRHRWSTVGGMIAGMTTARTLFCLEQLARDHWMRVVIRAEHAIPGKEIAHRLTASEPAMAQMKSALAAEDWPAKMPAALIACRGAEGAPRMTRVTGAARGGRWAMTGQTLVSFVIA